MEPRNLGPRLFLALATLAALTAAAVACGPGGTPAGAAAPTATACPSPGQFAPRARPSGSPAGFPTGGRTAPAATGTVASVKAGRITVDPGRGGQPVVVVTDASTTVRVAGAPGRLSDIKAGAMVVVMGTREADGTVLAAAIQVQPAGSCFGRGPGRGASTPTPAAS